MDAFLLSLQVSTQLFLSNKLRFAFDEPVLVGFFNQERE